LKIKDTQRVSWEWTLSRLGARQRTVAQVVSKEGSEGLTVYEVAEALKWPINSVSGRLSELERSGIIHDSGRRRLSPYSSKPCVVWVSSEIPPGVCPNCGMHHSFPERCPAKKQAGQTSQGFINNDALQQSLDLEFKS